MGFQDPKVATEHLDELYNKLSLMEQECEEFQVDSHHLNDYTTQNKKWLLI